VVENCEWHTSIHGRKIRSAPFVPSNRQLFSDRRRSRKDAFNQIFMKILLSLASASLVAATPQSEEFYRNAVNEKIAAFRSKSRLSPLKGEIRGSHVVPEENDGTALRGLGADKTAKFYEMSYFGDDSTCTTPLLSFGTYGDLCLDQIQTIDHETEVRISTIETKKKNGNGKDKDILVKTYTGFGCKVI
jgi:hypothetical protein